MASSVDVIATNTEIAGTGLAPAAAPTPAAPAPAAPAPAAPAPQSRGALVARALREPGHAFSYALARAKGWWYPRWYRATGRRFRAGRGLTVYGRLSVRGPGEVVFGDKVAVWGTVNAWTY